MVNDMLNRWKAEFARALRNFRYEKTEDGSIYFPVQDAKFGGIFTAILPDGSQVPGKNTVTLPWLNNLLDTYFNAASAPAAVYIAPFVNNTVPTSALTAGTFAGTQGEYTGYTEGARPQWVSDGAAASQLVGNSAAPATFTIGASATTIRGAGLISVPAKGSTSGILVAAALFDVANTLSPGSALKIKYSLSGAPAA